MNQRKIGALLSYLHILLSNTISILYTPYMLRMMGQSEYGLFGTANSFISYLSILSFGIGGAYIRFNARCRAENDLEGEKSINGMFMTVYACLALLVFAGGMGCIFMVDRLVEDTFTAMELHRLRIIIALLMVNMMITFVMNVVTMALQAYEKHIVLRTGTMLAAIATPLVNVIVLRFGGRAVAITIASLCISICCYTFYFIYALKYIKLRFSFRGFRMDVLKELFVFTSFLFLTSIADQITYSTDNIVLSAVKGTSAVAVYAVGSQFRNYFQQFSSAISSVFVPSVNMMVLKNQDRKELDALFIRVGRVQYYVIALVLIGYISIGKGFVRLWAGEDYTDAFWIGLVLMLSACVPSFQNVGLEIQKAMNKHKARSIVYFLVALCNLLLTIPCAIRWGGIGAAAATLITTFFGNVGFMNYYFWKHMNLDIPGFWGEILRISPGLIAPGLVGYLVNRYWAMDSFLDILLAAAAISFVYLVSTWLLSMNDYEHALLGKPVQKLIGRLRQ